MFFFGTHISYASFKSLECNFMIQKINLIVHLFYEKIQDSKINSTKFGDLSQQKFMPLSKT
jgi:hypothetical protein